MTKKELAEKIRQAHQALAFFKEAIKQTPDDNPRIIEILEKNETALQEELFQLLNVQLNASDKRTRSSCQAG